MVKNLKNISTGIQRTKLKPSEILNPDDLAKVNLLMDYFSIKIIRK